jgi:hypothetical protein
MKKTISPKIRTEAILTFILIFSSLLGYVPTWPYMLSNSILLLMPVLVFLNLNRIKFTNNIIAFVSVWLIISVLPFIVNSSGFFSENTSQKVIVFCLRIFGVLFAFFLGYTNDLKYQDLCKILFFIFILNFILMSVQFFFIRPMIMVKKGEVAEWQDIINPGSMWKKRVVGICGNANTVGSFVLFSVIFLFDWLRPKRKLLWFTIFLSVIAIGLYAKSRNNILVSLLFIGYYLLFVRKNLKPVITYTLFAIIFLIVVLLSSGSEVTDTIFQFSSFANKINSLTVRLKVNSEAINIWWNHLLFFGGGFSTETFFMGKFHSTRLFSEMLYTKYLIEMGIVGSATSALFLYVLYKNKLRNVFQKRIFKNIIFIMIFVSFFETVFITQQLFYLMIFIFAWLAKHPEDVQSSAL